MIAQAHGITTDQAFALIRAHARRSNHRLVDVADTVLTDLALIPELAPPERPVDDQVDAGARP
jgi:hypothetical protein